MPSLSRSTSEEDQPDLSAHCAGAATARGIAAHELEVYRSDLLRRATMLTAGDISQAKDLVQDTMERALRNLNRVVPGSNVRAWLYTVMVHKFRDNLRYERVHRTTDLDGSGELATSEIELPPAWTNVTTDQVRAALPSLSPELRTAFEHREFERMSYQRIAEASGVPVATVGTRLMRARQRLRHILASRLGFDTEEGT